MREFKELPKYRKAVMIEFWSLRTGICENMGVIFDCDEKVKRLCYRKKLKYGWKWVIKGFNRLPMYDIYADTDKEILDEFEDELGATFL